MIQSLEYHHNELELVGVILGWYTIWVYLQNFPAGEGGTGRGREGAPKAFTLFEPMIQSL